MFFSVATAYTYPFEIKNLSPEKVRSYSSQIKLVRANFLPVLSKAITLKILLCFSSRVVYSNTRIFPSSSIIIFEKYGKYLSGVSVALTFTVLSSIFSYWLIYCCLRSSVRFLSAFILSICFKIPILVFS